MTDTNTPLMPAVAALEESQRQSIVAFIIEAMGEYEVFTTQFGDALSTVIDGKMETYLVESSDLGKLLRRQYHCRFNKIASEKHIREAVAHLSSKALFAGVKEDVFLRTAKYKGKLYIDLCNAARQVIEISAGGIRTITDPPVHFLRLPGMKELPIPDLKGKLDELREIIELSDDTWVLFAGSLLACYHPNGPYPVMVLSGGHGSGKTTLTTIFRNLIDPVESPLRRLPTKLDDFWVMVRNERLLVFDNVSFITASASDTLCQISTGGGSSGRQLYSNHAQVTLAGRRPVILNGIAPVLTKEDLIDRTITIEVPSIPVDQFATEGALMEKFNRLYPRLLGAICNCLKEGIKRQKETVKSLNVRMSDVAEFVTRCEPALGWSKGTFIGAYIKNRSESHMRCLEDSPLYNALRILLADKPVWRGTAHELVMALRDNPAVPSHIRRAIPSIPNRLSAELHRVHPFLGGADISLSFAREKTRKRERVITIERKVEQRTIRPKPMPIKQKLKLVKARSAPLPVRV